MFIFKNKQAGLIFIAIVLNLCIRYYQSTLAMGKNERYYFAANSAISLGLIYEKRKDYAKAKSMYNTAIGLKNHDYEVGTEQKAKDGLKRIAS